MHTRRLLAAGVWGTCQGHLYAAQSACTQPQHLRKDGPHQPCKDIQHCAEAS